MALRRPRWAARATFAALVTVVVSVATALAGAAPAGPAPGAWKTIPGVRADFGQGIAAVGWASGRAWVALTGAGGNTISVTSARAAGRSLSGFETTRLNASLYVRLIAGSESRVLRLADELGLARGEAAASDRSPRAAERSSGSKADRPQPGPRAGRSPRGRAHRVGPPRGSRTGSVLWVCCAADGSGQNLIAMTASSRPRRARMPPWTLGCRVFTRPPPGCFRSTGVVGDLEDGQPLVPEQPRRPAGQQDLDVAARQISREPDEPGLVRYTQERTLDRRHGVSKR